MTQSIGSSYPVTIPALSDTASIVDALKYYHQGGLTGSPASNSIEQYIINANSRSAAIETVIGWPYSGSAIGTRLTDLESTVNGLGPATYVKSAPSTNDVAATRNLIQPANTGTIPLQIQGLAGHSVSLQEWKTSAATVAKVDQTGRMFSYDGSVMAEVVTISGTQSISNKTLLTPIQTIGTNAKTTSYTLVLTDQSKIIEVDSVSATTITIPSDTVAFPVGTYIVIIQTNTGQVSIAGTGFTPSFPPSLGLKLRERWSMATLIKRGANSWVVSGDLAA